MFSNSYKWKLNILISFYRKKYLKETGDGKWQQQSFYKDETNNISICSSKTYCSLENGKKVVRNNIYYIICKKLNKKPLERIDWDKIINLKSLELIEAMNRKNDQECINIIDFLLETMKNSKDILYYDEVCWLLKILKGFLMNKLFITEKEYDYLNELNDLFEGPLYEIYKYYLFVYANYHEDDKIEFVLKKYQYEKSTLISNKKFNIVQFERNGQILTALEKYKELSLNLKSTHYFIQKIFIDFDIAFLCLNVDKYETKKYCEKIEKSLYSISLSNNQKYLFHNNLGTLFLNLGEFESCIFHMENTIRFSKVKWIRIYSCIHHAYLMLGRNYIPKHLKEDHVRGDKVDYILYEYFLNYDKRTVEQNMKYLIEKVVASLKKNDDLYKLICEREIFRLCSNTKHYKYLYLFELSISK